MPNCKLPVWTTLGHALRAPFSLEPSSWKALIVPLLAVITATILPIAAHYIELQWSETAGWLAVLPIWAAIAFLALEYQRQLLLGPEASKSNPQPWRRYGLYVLALGAIFVGLAVFTGFLLRLMLPAMTFFMMALNSPHPWLVLGTAALLTVVLIVVSYFATRFSLILPSLSVDHDVTGKRIWRLGRSNGLRLVSLLVLIPGLINVLLYLALPIQLTGFWFTTVNGIVDIYFALFYLSIIALAYQTLSDQPLPTRDRTRGGAARGRLATLLKPVGLFALAAIVATALWDSIYRVEPDENVFVSRFGNPERFEHNAGIRMKIPFAEDAKSMAKSASYVTRGEDTFLTMSKGTLALSYELRWRIVDGDVFSRAVAGRTSLADMRVDHIARDTLRSEVSKLSIRDVAQLRDAGAVKFFDDAQADEDSLFNGVLSEINSSIAMMGIEIGEGQIETTLPR